LACKQSKRKRASHGYNGRFEPGLWPIQRHEQTRLQRRKAPSGFRFRACRKLSHARRRSLLRPGRIAGRLLESQVALANFEPKAPGAGTCIGPQAPQAPLAGPAPSGLSSTICMRRSAPECRRLERGAAGRRRGSLQPQASTSESDLTERASVPVFKMVEIRVPTGKQRRGNLSAGCASGYHQTCARN